MTITKFDAIQSLVGGQLASDPEGENVNYIDGQKQPTEKEIDAELKRLEDDFKSKEYQRLRASEFPSIPDQLDEIYHNGIDSWKAVIKKTKDKYPK